MFKMSGYQFLDKNFKPAQNKEDYKYLVKVPKAIQPNDQVALDTEYKIWDPSTGIHLGPITFIIIV
jgi:hypothetical protein